MSTDVRRKKVRSKVDMENLSELEGGMIDVKDVEISLDEGEKMPLS